MGGVEHPGLARFGLVSSMPKSLAPPKPLDPDTRAGPDSRRPSARHRRERPRRRRSMPEPRTALCRLPRRARRPRRGWFRWRRGNPFSAHRRRSSRQCIIAGEVIRDGGAEQNNRPLAARFGCHVSSRSPIQAAAAKSPDSVYRSIRRMAACFEASVTKYSASQSCAASPDRRDATCSSSSPPRSRIARGMHPALPAATSQPLLHRGADAGVLIDSLSFRPAKARHDRHSSGAIPDKRPRTCSTPSDAPAASASAIFSTATAESRT